MMDTLASQPTAKWLGGWNANVQSDVQTVQQAANAKGQTAVYAVYNIPGRDCGGFSAGGITADTYPAWIKSIAAGIGSGKRQSYSSSQIRSQVLAVSPLPTSRRASHFSQALLIRSKLILALKSILMQVTQVG
jgi:hypothetical protein